MLGAVDFNDELVSGTVEIDDIIAELLLPAELGWAGTEVVVPEMALLGVISRRSWRAKGLLRPS